MNEHTIEAGPGEELAPHHDEHPEWTGAELILESGFREVAR